MVKYNDMSALWLEYIENGRERSNTELRSLLPHLLKLARFLLPWGIDKQYLKQLEEEWRPVNPRD